MKILGYLSVFLCLTFLIANYINIFLNLTVKKRSIYSLIIIIIAVGIIALCTDPYEGDDLSRYFIMIDSFKTEGLNYIAQFPYKINIITTTLFYLVSLTNNSNLLTFISTSIFYISIFIYTNKVCKDVKESRYISLYFIMFASFIYLNQTISGVRFPLAIASFLLIFLFDAPKKIGYKLLYIIPVLIHTAALTLLLVVAMAEILTIFSDKNKLCKTLSFGMICLSYIGLLIGNFFPTGILFLSDALERLKIYADPSFYLQFIDIRSMICSWILFIIIVYLFYKFRDEIEKKYGFYYMNLTMSLILLCLGLLPFPLIVSRYQTILYIMSLVLFKEIGHLSKMKKNLITIVLVIICLGMFAYRLVNAYHYWRFY